MTNVNELVGAAATLYLVKELAVPFAIATMKLFVKRQDEIAPLRAFARASARLIEDVKVVNKVQAFPAATEPVALPQDVLDFCEDESELFAQESCKARALERFAKNADWNAVGASLWDEERVRK